jgi:thiol-disulfide isomerase/thioredoxin
LRGATELAPSGRAQQVHLAHTRVLVACSDSRASPGEEVQMSEMLPGPARALARVFFVSLVAAAPLAAKSDLDTRTISPIAAVADTSLALAGKVVYVDFWASWCVPCRQSFPWMNGMLDKYEARGLRVVTVNLDRKPPDGRKFMRELGTTLPVVFDSTGTFAKLYRLEAMPTSFIYGRDGKLRVREEGFHTDHAEDVERTIQTLLDEKGVK